MLDAIGLRRTKWKRLSLNTNVTAIQCPPCHEISPNPGNEGSSSCVREQDRGSLIGNIALNYKDKTPAYDPDGEESKLNRKPNICRRCSVTTNVAEIQCIARERVSEKLTNSSLTCNYSPLDSSVLSSYEHKPRPRKRALLVGVTYKNSKYKLKRTVNDVKNMRNLLINSFGFNPQNIIVLTEDEKEPGLTPTKKNIKIYLKWLVHDCQAGDSLVFYFSGLGLRRPDLNLEEWDGFEETICPVDFIKEGLILANDINNTIVWPLPKGVTLHAIADACHSGTILDLVYVYDRER
ncbi:metacaspase-1-like [Hevea brasiliensis]|nr:metacaspase-1-like [Hevea brasiliensis]